MSRRQFVQSSAAAAAGLLLAGCAASPPAESVASTEAVPQSQPAHTPAPSTATPFPTNTSPAEVANLSTSEPAAAAANTTTPESTAAAEKALIAGIAQAATQFLESLDPAQREQAMYAFTNEERFRWHWTTPRNVPRNGLPLTEMSETQKAAALALLQVSLSNMGFEKALNIMSLQRDLGNDPELYYVTVFGAPDSGQPWGWRWEGHHLSRQFTIVGEQVVMTPFFLGSWPTTTEAGLRAMEREEDAALELVNSLVSAGRESVIFQTNTLTKHVTQNAAQVAPLEPVGLLYAEMTEAQQQLVNEIIQTYVGTLPQPVAGPALARLNSAGLEQLRFGWAGSLEHRRPQYYRLQGQTFLLEFDNSRNGGTHIHSVWRDFERDFGYHLL